MNSYTGKHDSITVSARDKISRKQSYYECCNSSDKSRYGDDWNRSRNCDYCKSSTGTCTGGNANDILAATITTITFFSRFNGILERGAAKV